MNHRYASASIKSLSPPLDITTHVSVYSYLPMSLFLPVFVYLPPFLWYCVFFLSHFYYAGFSVLTASRQNKK